MGLAREIPDVGTNWHGLARPQFPSHPGGDVQKVFGLSNLLWQPNPRLGYYGNNFWGTKSIGLDPNLRESVKDIPDYMRRHYPPEYPLRIRANDSFAHELQHASQDEAGRNILPKAAEADVYNVPYSQRPWENEATAVGYRAIRPESYLYPFHQMQTTDYDKFSDILNQLKQK